MIKVLLINDYPLIGNLISASLGEETGIKVVQVCTPEDDLIAAISQEAADVILISGQLAAIKTIDLVSQIDALGLPLKMVILGLDERKQTILPYLEAGASGYVLKDASIDELIAAIGAAHQDKARISPEIARALIERVYTLAGEFTSVDASILNRVELTRREIEILELVDQGLTNNQIAQNLYVEVGTVKNHMHSILQKLEVKTRHEAARYLALLRDDSSELSIIAGE